MLIRRRSRFGVVGVLLALGLVGALFVACGGDDEAGDQDEMAMENDAEEGDQDEMAMEEDAEEGDHEEMAMEEDAEEGGHEEMAMEDAEEGGAHVAGEQHDAAEGVVRAQPDNSTRIGITLREWAILSDTEEVEAGTVYFLVENQGPEHPHELVVIRSDRGLGEFPIVDGIIPEDTLDIVDEIEEFAVGSWASIAFDLKPGRYILLCNVAEIEEDGTFRSHYELGMRVPFIVR